MGGLEKCEANPALVMTDVGDFGGRSQFSDGFTSASPWLLILISTASVHEGVAVRTLVELSKSAPHHCDS